MHKTTLLKVSEIIAIKRFKRTIKLTRVAQAIITHLGSFSHYVKNGRKTFSKESSYKTC